MHGYWMHLLLEGECLISFKVIDYDLDENRREEKAITLRKEYNTLEKKVKTI